MDYKDSFIYNEFVQRLLKSAQAVAPTPAEVAPVADPAATRGKSINDYAKEMIANLETQVSEFTSDSADARLLPQNLTSLNSLFIFLSKNNIKKSGFAIVLPNDATGAGIFNALNDQNKAQYSNFPDVDDDPDFFVNKALLSEYLQDLLSKNDPLLNSLLKQRISEANSQLKLDLKPTAKKPGEPGFEEARDKFEEARDKFEKARDKANSYFKDNSEQANAQTPARQQNMRQALIELSQSMPFDNNDISFVRISDFIKAYSTVIGMTSDRSEGDIEGGSEARGQFNAITTSMQNARKSLKVDKSIFLLQNQSPDQFKQLVKDPQATYYSGFVQNLKEALGETAQLLNSFSQRYSKRLEEANLKDLVQRQLNIYKENNNKLSLLERG